VGLERGVEEMEGWEKVWRVEGRSRLRLVGSTRRRMRRMRQMRWNVRMRGSGWSDV
jgi:hypothetical protein